MQDIPAAPTERQRKPRPAVALSETLHPEQRLKFTQVSTLVGLGRTKVYELIAAGEFPQPERRGKRWSRWRAGSVLEWLAASRGAQ